MKKKLYLKIKSVTLSYAEAAYHLFLFKPHTTMPRTLEIFYGVTAWLALYVVCSSLFNLLTK